MKNFVLYIEQNSPVYSDLSYCVVEQTSYRRAYEVGRGFLNRGKQFKVRRDSGTLAVADLRKCYYSLSTDCRVELVAL